jgi:hypothetical protein
MEPTPTPASFSDKERPVCLSGSRALECPILYFDGCSGRGGVLIGPQLPPQLRRCHLQELSHIVTMPPSFTSLYPVDANMIPYHEEIECSDHNGSVWRDPAETDLAICTD